MTSLDRQHATADDAPGPVLAPRRQPSLALRRSRERKHAAHLWATDAAVILASVAGAAVLQAQGRALLGSPISIANTVIVAAVTAGVWLLALALFSAHEPRVMGSGTTEYKRVAHATWVAFGVLAIAFVIFGWPGFRGQLMFALPAGLLALEIARWRWRHWLRGQRVAGPYAFRTLVVGRRRDIEYVIEQLSKASDAYAVVGVVVTDGTDSSPLVVGSRIYPVIPGMETAQAARTLQTDTIVVASIPDDDPEFVRNLSWRLEGTAAELILSSRLTDIAGPRVSLSPLEGLPLIHVKIPSFEGPAHTLKRLLDIIVSTLASIVVCAVTPFIALAIRLDSRGPVFFRQRRVGRDGREFTMYKFRSMTDTAEQELAELLHDNDGSGPLFKLKADPRVTRVGRILRKYSLDELPQFFNVLKGDMSITGPRPPLPSEVRNYEGKVFRRLYIKPGITGLWQVSGRSDLSWEDSVALDLRYVENWSVTLDLMIMWRTVKVMLRPVGAY
jgi:exopolysaccharide biosynthesis polyprenyl glycosylphosphotransferase